MIELEGLPELVDPVLIAAFEGWNDAGEASSGAIAHLEAAWKAEPLPELDPEDYYDFQVTRPDRRDGRGRDPLDHLADDAAAAARPPGVDRDVVLLRGIEPNMRWRSFCAEILGDLPRARRRAGRDAGRAAQRLPAHPPGAGRRHGHRPGLARSINLELSPLRGADRHRGRAAGGVRRGRACARCRCGRRCRTTWPSRPTPRPRWRCCAGSKTCWTSRCRWATWPRRPAPGSTASTSWPPQDSEVAEYVRELEERKDAAELPEASGDAIAAEFERYLRRRDRHSEHLAGQVLAQGRR